MLLSSCILVSYSPHPIETRVLRPRSPPCFNNSSSKTGLLIHKPKWSARSWHTLVHVAGQDEPERWTYFSSTIMLCISIQLHGPITIRNTINTRPQYSTTSWKSILWKFSRLQLQTHRIAHIRKRQNEDSMRKSSSRADREL